MAALAAALRDLDARSARRACVLALALGLLYAAVNPPFAASDELYHLARANELSLGRGRELESDGRSYCDVPMEWRAAAQSYGSLPERRSLRVSRAELRKALTTAAEAHEPWHLEDPLSARSPVAYTALLPGLWLGRGLGLPPLSDVYAARVSGLLLWCALIYLALSVGAALAWSLLPLALTPALLAQAGAASPEGLTAGLAFLFVALLERITSAPSSPSSARERALLIGVFVLLVCCNPACLLFGLTLPLVAWSDAPQRLARLGRAALVIAASSAGAAVLSDLGTDQHPFALSPELEAQLGWAFSNPLELVAMVWRTLFRSIDDYVLQFFVVREVLSEQMRFSAGVVATLELELILLLALGSARGRSDALPHKARWLARAARRFNGGVFLQALVTSVKVGPGRLQNVYGRLFFAVGPLLVAALAYTGRPLARRWLLRRGGLRVFLVCAGLNLFWLFMLGARFYGPNRPPWKY
jgi:hypothetical protein